MTATVHIDGKATADTINALIDWLSAHPRGSAVHVVLHGRGRGNLNRNALLAMGYTVTQREVMKN